MSADIWACPVCDFQNDSTNGACWHCGYEKRDEEYDLKLLKAGLCHIHLCSLLERYNQLEGGVSRYCPDCEDEALGCCPF